MLHFVLCDDNVQILNKLERTLESIFIKNNIDAQILLKATTSEEVLKYVENHTVDVLILDINLKSTISGCDVANMIRSRNKNIYIIFLTGHLEYALVAYKYKTFDYLPKPLCDERLENTILRLYEDVQNSNVKFLKLNNNTIINQDDINYIKKDGMKLVVCTENRTYEAYSSFSKIQPCLPSNFVRCHKSYIINVNNIENFVSDNNKIQFEHGSFCFVGAKYKDKFLEVFENGNFTNNMDFVIK